jgi:hypothetical protein
VELRKWKLKLSVSEQERNGCTETMFIFQVTEKELEMVTKIWSKLLADFDDKPLCVVKLCMKYLKEL